MPLTSLKIRTAKTREKAYKLFDAGGLYVLVTEKGYKCWRLKYRFEGKEKVLSFGTYPELTLKEARSKRDAARAVLRTGKDPGPIQKEEKARERAERREAQSKPFIQVNIDGLIELWKGNNVMRLTADEARFIARLLDNITR